MNTLKCTSAEQFFSFLDFFRRRKLHYSTSYKDLTITIYRLNPKQTEELFQEFAQHFHLTKIENNPHALAA